MRPAELYAMLMRAALHVFLKITLPLCKRTLNKHAARHIIRKKKTYTCKYSVTREEQRGAEKLHFDTVQRGDRSAQLLLTVSNECGT